MLKLTDIHRRELIAKGQTGGLVIFDDRPNYWDAWGTLFNYQIPRLAYMLLDVEIHHLETAHQLEFSNIEVVAEGPLRASVKSVIKYGKSTINVIVGICSFGRWLATDENGLDILGCYHRLDSYCF